MRIKGLDEKLIQKYMAEAFLILMERKPYGKITVKEICEKAGVNRSSYYRHFKNREDIIRFWFSGLMDEYLYAYDGISPEERNFERYLFLLFKTFYSHRKELLCIHKNKMTHLLLDVLNRLEENGGYESRDHKRSELERAYHVGGIYNSLVFWIGGGMVTDPSEMTSLTMEFLPERMSLFMNGN